MHRQSANPSRGLLSTVLQVGLQVHSQITCSRLLASCWLWGRVRRNAPGHLEKCGEIHSTNQVISCQACKVCAGADAERLADTCEHRMADCCIQLRLQEQLFSLNLESRMMTAMTKLHEHILVKHILPHPHN